MTWNNNDGLVVKFGTEEGTAGKAGQYRSHGPAHTVELVLDLTSADLGTSEAIMDRHTILPEGALIESVTIVTTEVAVGGTSVDIGLFEQDESATIDTDGLVNTILTANMNVIGETTVLRSGDSLAGALVGTILADAGYISALRVGTFTAGKISVRIEHSIPA